MADLTSTILSFIQAAKQIADYCEEVHEAPHHLRELCAELHSLMTICELLEQARSRLENKLQDRNVETLLQSHLQSWRTLLKGLADFLESMLPSGGGKHGRSFRNWRVLKLPFKDDITSRTQEIGKLKIDFIFLLQFSESEINQKVWTALAETLIIIQQLREDASRTQIDVQREKIVAWLQPAGFEDELQKFEQSYIDDSCEWILKRDEYTRWDRSTGEHGTRILWIHGGMGRGKSFLSQFLRQKSMGDFSKMVVYFAFRSTRRISTQRSFLGTILFTLLGRLRTADLESRVLSRLYEIYSSRTQSQAVVNEALHTSVLMLIGAAARERTPVFVIDALDECTKDDVRQVLGRLIDCARQQENVKIVLLGREPWKFYKEAFESTTIQNVVELTSALTEDGVEKFIRHRVAQHQILSQLDEKICDDISKRASGWYLFARLLIDDLSEEVFEEDIDDKLKTLKELPRELTFIYENVLKRMSAMALPRVQLARKMFSWLLISAEPMSISTMAAAIQGSKRLLVPNEVILEICSPFVEIDHIDQTVRFIHASVKEEFQKRVENLVNSNSSTNHTRVLVSRKEANFDAGSTCVEILEQCLQTASDDGFSIENMTSHPFLKYAVVHWPRHIRESFDDYDAPVLLVTNRILDRGDTFRRWCKSRAKVDIDFYTLFLSIKPQPLHVAAYDGLTAFVRVSCNVSPTCGDKYGSPSLALLVAANRGHFEVVDYLLSSGLQPTGTDYLGRTALFHACAHGHTAIMERILKNSPESARVTDKSGILSIHLAAYNKEEKTALALLENCKAWLTAENYGKLLRVAAERGLINLTKQLLTQSKDQNITVALDMDGGEDKNALHLAVINGNSSITMHLIELGADLMAQTRMDKSSALHLAAKRGDETLTQRLVEELRKTDKSWTSLKDWRMWTPLHTAARAGHLNTVVALLKNLSGIEKARAINTPSDWNSYPLSLGAEEGSYDVCLALIENGANVNVRDDDLQTPLWVAAARGYESVVELLLKHGANAQVVDKYQRTALEIAISKGFCQIAAMLKVTALNNPQIHHGFTRIPWSEGFEQLRRACQYGEVGEVRALLNSLNDKTKRAWLHSTDSDGNSLLHLSAFSGSKEMVQFLVEHGVKLHVNRLADSPLDIAIKKKHHDMVVFLSEKLQSDKGYRRSGFSTTLHRAAESGNLELVRNLILMPSRTSLSTMPVDEYINAPNQWWSTPLHLGVESRNVEVVDFLLEHGADVSSQNVWLQTPLDIAKKMNQHLIVQKLEMVPQSTERRHRPRPVEDGDNELHQALKKHDLPGIRKAISLDPSCLDESNGRDERAIHLAVQTEDQSIVEEIIKHGPDVRLLAKDKMSALHFACMRKTVEITKALIAAGANVEERNFWQWTPLHYAARAGSPQTVELLLAHLAPVDAITDDGQTALHFASRRGNQEIIHLLKISGRAREDLIDHRGRTASDLRPDPPS